MIRLAAFLALLPAYAQAVSCRDMSFDGASYTVCEVDPAREHLALYHRDGEAALGGFGALRDHVAPREVVFAMNAGMYHADLGPVGLYIQNHETLSPIVTRSGPGNFGLLPNGVLCLTEDAVSVWETRAFAAAGPDCRDATQSGPMLVTGGQLHPRFIPGGTSLNIRNGVGVRADGMAVFAISNDPVNFDSFGRLFRDVLDTPDALFLDGSISRLYAPGHGRYGFGFAALGPMIAVTR